VSSILLEILALTERSLPKVCPSPFPSLFFAALDNRNLIFSLDVGTRGGVHYLVLEFC
jgi:hypothetical protein